MSVAFFAGAEPVPLRGEATTSALLELLAITRWADQDVLILDMPPGLGDTSLDVIHLLPRLEFLLIGNGSRVVIESVRRAVQLLTELDVPLLGLMENMTRGSGDAVARFGVPLLGSIPYDDGLEASLGDVEKLRRTSVYRVVAALAGELI